MNATQFTTTAQQIVDGFDTTAHSLIDAYREGGERFGTYAKHRWDAALKESSAQLTAETRRNAQHARKVFGGYYTKGVALSAAGAETAVDTVVQVARNAIERATARQQTRA